MWGQIDYQTAKDRQAEFLREAEERRRVRAFEAAQQVEAGASRSSRPARPVFHAVGRGLVAVGSRLMAL
jgi:hypothetical protein